jgi:hypothetical protein
MQNNTQPKTIAEYQDILDRAMKGEEVTKEEEESLKLLSENALEEITNILNNKE